MFLWYWLYLSFPWHTCCNKIGEFICLIVLCPSFCPSDIVMRSVYLSLYVPCCCEIICLYLSVDTHCQSKSYDLMNVCVSVWYCYIVMRLGMKGSCILFIYYLYKDYSQSTTVFASTQICRWTDSLCCILLTDETAFTWGWVDSLYNLNGWAVGNSHAAQCPSFHQRFGL